MISTEPLKETVRRAVPEGWAGHPHLWIVACDYASGERVVFGRRTLERRDALGDGEVIRIGRIAVRAAAEIAGENSHDARGGAHAWGRPKQRL